VVELIVRMLRPRVKAGKLMCGDDQLSRNYHSPRRWLDTQRYMLTMFSVCGVTAPHHPPAVGRAPWWCAQKRPGDRSPGSGVFPWLCAASAMPMGSSSRPEYGFKKPPPYP